MMASYCRPACVCVGRRGLFLSRVCICECVFSWLLFMFRIILVISENCVKSSERASSVCCFRGCSFMICVCVCHNLSVCVCVSVCSGQMVPDENYWWSSCDHYYWSVITVEKGFTVFSRAGKQTHRGSYCSPQGDKLLCVCAAVCVTTEQGRGLTQKHMYTR